MLYKVVVDNLNKIAITNSKKTIAQAIIDGDISVKDLENLNTSIAFPANAYNRLKLPEGEYSSQDAMMQFVRAIGPYLSNRILYELTRKLVDIECNDGFNTEAFRTSTLAKGFIVYELERHSSELPAGKLPDTFLAHMKEFIFPLCKRNWPDKFEKNVNTFASFNISSSSLPPDIEKKYTGINVYKEVMQFDQDKLDPNDLSTSPPNKFNIKFEYQWPERKSQNEDAKMSDSLGGTTSNSSDSSDLQISAPSNFANVTHFFASNQSVIQRGSEVLNVLSRQLERAKEWQEVNSEGLKLVNTKIGVGARAKVQLIYRKLRNNEDLTKEERIELEKFQQKLLKEIKSNEGTISSLTEISDNLENKLFKTHK